MPGPYPGRVVTVHSPRCIDEATEKVDVPTVQAMIASGMTTLTGDKDPRDSWARFFNAQDFVGIKVNCLRRAGRDVDAGSGGGDREQPDHGRRQAGQHRDPRARRRADPAAEVRPVRRRPAFASNPRTPGWASIRTSTSEANFFGEDDTRSYLIRMVTEQFTKIINVPNMKDHGASGVTGCLKNIAYGEFNNVARSHYHAQTETLTFIGTLAAIEPLRSRTVLNIMDGLRGVWHAGPFSSDKRYRFYPKQMKFGTDPVAIDRLLIDIIDNKRKQEGAISVWDRDMKYFSTKPRGLAARPEHEPLRSASPATSSTRRRSAWASTTRPGSSTRKSRYDAA